MEFTRFWVGTGTGNRIQSFNGITFSHDADGNVTQKYKAGVYDRKYWYSAEARLDSAQHDNWSKVKYDYDALGRPVRKWRGDPNGWTFDRYWIYDGDQRVISFDPSGSRIEEYAYAPGIDRPIATIRGASTIDAYGYHVQDELGNILGIIENGAYISQTLSYDAWGVPTETGHAYNNQLWWKSLKWEGDVISLYYMRNRWYDPETGRFMSEDPIGLAGGINQYTFANNDPVNGWDPYGLCDYEYWYSYNQTTGEMVPGSWRSQTIAGTCAYTANDGRPYGEGGGSGVGRGEGWGVPTGPGGGAGGGSGSGVSSAGDPTVRDSCFERNKFSSLLANTPFQSAAEIVEIGSEISFLGDLLATQKKFTRMGAGGMGKDYASGMNRLFRFVARDMVGSPALHRKLLAVGNRATVPTAFIGAFSAGYNASIAAQCAMRVIR